MKKLMLLIIFALLESSMFSSDLLKTYYRIDFFFVEQTPKIQHDVFWKASVGGDYYWLYASDNDGGIETRNQFFSVNSHHENAKVQVESFKMKLSGKWRHECNWTGEKELPLVKFDERDGLWTAGIRFGVLDRHIKFESQQERDAYIERERLVVVEDFLPDFIKTDKDLKKFRDIDFLEYELAFRVNGGELRRQTFKYKVKVRSIPGWKLMMMQ